MKKLILIFLLFPLIVFGQLEEQTIQIQEVKTTTDRKFEFVKLKFEKLKTGLIELRTKEVLRDDESYPEQTKAFITDIDALIAEYEPLFSEYDTIYMSVTENEINQLIEELEDEKLRIESSDQVNDDADKEILKLDKLITKNKEYLKEFETTKETTK